MLQLAIQTCLRQDWCTQKNIPFGLPSADHRIFKVLAYPYDPLCTKNCLRKKCVEYKPWVKGSPRGIWFPPTTSHNRL